MNETGLENAMKTCHPALMATLMIRDLPDDLHARLEELARQNHRSLDQQAVAVLEESLTGVTKQERVEISLGRILNVRRGIKRFLTAEEIDLAINESRR